MITKPKDCPFDDMILLKTLSVYLEETPLRIPLRPEWVDWCNGRGLVTGNRLTPAGEVRHRELQGSADIIADHARRRIRVGQGDKLTRTEFDAIGSTYLGRSPKAVPSGRFLVHNHIKRPTRSEDIGFGGFRVWLQLTADDEDVVLCDCGWAPELGKHYITAPLAERRHALHLEYRYDGATVL
jgi:hypothetical protein